MLEVAQASEAQRYVRHGQKTNESFLDTVTLKLIIVVLLLVCVAGAGLAGTLNYFAIVEAVNSKLKDGEQFGLLGWWIGKTLRLHSEYRRLYPSGNLLRRQGYYFLAGATCLSIITVLLNFGFPGVIFFPAVSGIIAWAMFFQKNV